MKKLLTIACTFAISILFIQCGSSKRLPKTPDAKIAIEEAPKEKANVQQSEGVEIAIPLSEPEYRSTTEYYRVTQEGVSPTTSMAKKIAMQNAREELATSVMADIGVVIQNYGTGRDIDFTQTVQTKYQSLAHTTVSQQLSGVTLVGEKLFKLAENKYKYYVCLQMAKSVLGDKIAEAIAKDKELRQDFDIERFKKVYDEQMQILKNN